MTPVYHNGTLVGYIEIGKDIKEVLDSSASRSRTEMMIFIHKNELYREHWESGMEMLGRDHNWDAYPDQVLTYSTIALPDEFLYDISNIHDFTVSQGSSHESKKLRNGERIWVVSGIPLTDSAGNEIGDLFILQDVTASEEAFSNHLKFVIVFLVLIFGILSTLYYIILKRTDNSILKSEWALYESDRKNRAILDALPVLAFECKRDGTFLDYQAHSGEATLVPEEEFLGKKICDVLPKDVAKQVMHAIDQAFQTGEAQNFQYQLSVNDDIRDYEARIIGSMDDDVLIIIVDITTYKLAEHALARARNISEELIRIKSEFLANMSHELRTPLNSIIGFSDVLLGDSEADLTERQTRYLSNISKSGKHLLSLINDILDISKVEAGNMDFNPEMISLSEVIFEVENSMKLMAQKKNIIIELDLKPNDVKICADRTKLRQIMYNLYW
ncbi:PAS domain-containing protein [Methanohalophilus levihalophilus]|nr:PAS domain-containing protein [Methanohalophilus levihalophilus]